MTDLGSVGYDALPDLSKGEGPEDMDRVHIDIPAHPRKFLNKPKGIPRKQQAEHPPTIQEAYSMEKEEENSGLSSGTAMTNIQGILEIEQIPVCENKVYSEDQSGNSDNKINNGDVRTRSLKRTNAVMVDSVEHELDDESKDLSDEERKFGSGDLLTDNDSLEKVDKIGYTNVIADVTVHEYNTAEEKSEGRESVCDKSENLTNKSVIGAQGDVSNETTKVCLDPCNKTVEEKNSKVARDSVNKNAQMREMSSSVNSTISDMDKSLDESVSYRTLESSLSMNDIEIDMENPDKNKTIDIHQGCDRTDTADKPSERVEKTEHSEKQIVGNGSDKIHVEKTKSMTADTDCNKNQTKGLVTFQENQDGEITKDVIVPVHSNTLEAKPPKSPKSATGRRESWAARKLKKTFGLKDKGDQDEDDEKGKNVGSNGITKACPSNIYVPIFFLNHKN